MSRYIQSSISKLNVGNDVSFDVKDGAVYRLDGRIITINRTQSGRVNEIHVKTPSGQIHPITPRQIVGVYRKISTVSVIARTTGYTVGALWRVPTAVIRDLTNRAAPEAQNRPRVVMNYDPELEALLDDENVSEGVDVWEPGSTHEFQE